MSRSAHACAIYDAYPAFLTYTGRQNGHEILEKAGVEKVSADIAGGWCIGAG
jgi:hypothetical protein